MFGIERDAYFFNMIWASYNLLFLVGALLVAWERPQRRADERVRCEVPARIVNGSVDPRDDAGRESCPAARWSSKAAGPPCPIPSTSCWA